MIPTSATAVAASQVELDLPSGAKLKIQIAPFAIAKALYQAMLRELRTIQFSMSTDMENSFKDAFCAGFYSEAIENWVWKCFERCTYNGSRIDKDTFEPIAARDDYVKVCVEVMKANVFPFVKSLFAEYTSGVKMAENAQASRPETTT